RGPRLVGGEALLEEGFDGLEPFGQVWVLLGRRAGGKQGHQDHGQGRSAAAPRHDGVAHDRASVNRPSREEVRIQYTNGPEVTEGCAPSRGAPGRRSTGRLRWTATSPHSSEKVQRPRPPEGWDDNTNHVHRERAPRRGTFRPGRLPLRVPRSFRGYGWRAGV